MLRTQEVIEGELVVVPDLYSEDRGDPLLRLIQRPELLL